jgi:peptidoglycan/xylan/chitin deacetylase (PgdA/CDA1 family)
MSTFMRRLQDGTLPADAVAVTFDDGYADNLTAAGPRLEAAGVPATIFVVAGALGRAREFWWDEIARGILSRRESLDCEIPIDGLACRLIFPESEAWDDELRANASWRAWQEPLSTRQRVFLDVWRRLRDAPAAARSEAMDVFRQITNLPIADPADLPMALSDVAQMAGDSLFEIGGHTLTHAPLPSLAPAHRRREIEGGKRRCEELTGRQISGFAYPHGAVDDDCRAAVRESGFAWACTTAPGPVRKSSDPHALPRLFVQDWDAPTFQAALT